METYIRNEKTITGQLDENLVMVDIEKGNYFSLNTVATRIWELLEAPLTVDDLCKKLTDEYDVSLEQCRTEIENYLSQMQELDLVQRNG